MSYSFFKLSFLTVLLSVIFIRGSVSVLAQEDDSSIKFGVFYPPTITNTPTPTKIPTPTLSQQSPEDNASSLPPPNPPQSPRSPTPTPTPSSCTQLITSSKQIIDSLSRGFWNDFNHSSLYPKFFDDDLFQKTKGNVCLGEDENGIPYPENCTGQRPDGSQLFWCTLLPMKSYEKLGLYMPQNLYSVANMKDWFVGERRFLKGTAVWSEIPIGSTIFFADKKKLRLRHVALVTAKNRNYITIYESNNYVRSRKLTVSTTGTIQGGINIIAGFGTPPAQCKSNAS